MIWITVIVAFCTGFLAGASWHSAHIEGREALGPDPEPEKPQRGSMSWE